MNVEERERRVVFLAPTLRDSNLTASLFSRAGISMTMCVDLRSLCEEIAAGAGAILLAEEALHRPDFPLLEDALNLQPPWSDFAILILTRGGRDSVAATRAMETMGNVTLIERPVRIPTLVSAVQSALRSRQRQYQIRQHLEDREKTEARLRENDRRKDEFLAMLAHELRNPLSAIANSVQLIRSPVSESQHRWATEVMEAQVGHLSRMIDDLLDVSRITRGKITLKRQRIDLAQVLLSAAATARPIIEERRHELILHLAEGPFPTYSDATRLEQIFVNLLNNAAKFTEPGGTIHLTSSTKEGRFIVSVKDSGIGMPEDLLNDAFELFVQGDRGIARSEGGLGIGLTLVRSLVAMHGGTITAHSDGPGRGSEFTVSLPLSRPGATGPITPMREIEEEVSVSLRILVVDDNVDAALSLGELLQVYGHEVRVTHDGTAALRRSREMRPDVILLDIGLPGMDGYEVASALRAEGFHDTLLIAISGYAEEARSKEGGFDHHLVKPVDFSKLKSLIAKG
jgi:signal transduction histidine kinase/CheY-like chemotaxis protein